MTYISSSAASSIGLKRHLGMPFSEVLRLFLSTIAANRRRRRAVGALATLDNHVLHDIGLIRSEAAYATRCGRGDPSDY